MSKFLTEFKEFAMRGNVIDMAVGVVIGGAFGKIVTALVDSVIMPLVGIATGGADFSDQGWVLREAVGDQPEVVLAYGAFIQAIIDFLIIAFCIFLAVKAINKLSRKKEEAPEEPAAPAGPTQEELLTQIRDLLEKKN
jgi:large conductance mechanosensitive channel